MVLRDARHVAYEKCEIPIIAQPQHCALPKHKKKNHKSLNFMTPNGQAAVAYMKPMNTIVSNLPYTRGFSHFFRQLSWTLSNGATSCIFSVAKPFTMATTCANHSHCNNHHFQASPLAYWPTKHIRGISWPPPGHQRLFDPTAIYPFGPTERCGQQKPGCPIEEMIYIHSGGFRQKRGSP